jgi:DNA polymerase (family 10)
MISINPDAHSIAGLDDIKYGIYVAQKGLLKVDMCFNAQDLSVVQKVFNAKVK